MSGLGRIWRLLGAPFRSADASSPALHAVGAASNSASAPPRHVDHAQLDDQLASLFQNNTTVRAGNVQFLGLENIQRTYAAVWHRIADKVDQAARREIEHHLAPGDVYSRMGDGYMILFASRSIEEAEHCCAMIAENLSNKLMGDERTDQALTVTSIVVEVDGTVSKRRVQGINDLKNILAAERRRRKTGAARPTKPSGHASRPAEQTPNAAKRPPGGPRPPAQGKGTASRGRCERLDLAVVKERKRRQNEFLTALKETKDTYEFMYEPLWNVASDVVGTYRCLPSQVTEEGDLLVGDDALKETDDATATSLSWRIHMLDWNCLNRVIKDLARISSDEETNFLAAAPVHLATLADSMMRAEYLALCGTIPDRARRFLVFELVGVDPQAYHETVLRAVTFLKPHCRTIILSRPIEHCNFNNVETIGLHSVGPDLSGYRGPESSLQRMMVEYVEQAGRSGLATYICGLSSLSMATAAIGAGFNFIAGSAIAALTDRPSGIVDFHLANLFMPRSAADDLFDSLPAASAAMEGEPTEPTGQDPLNDLVGSEAEIALARRLVEVHGLSLEDAMLLAHVKLK